MYIPHYPSQSHYLTIQGLKLHLRHWPRPDHPKLLLLHGWMDASATFQFFVDALKPHYDIYALDWRGFGLSQHQNIGYYDRFVMLIDLHKICQYLTQNSGPIHLLGHSMGGIIASLYAGALPENIKTLTIVEGFGVKRDQLAETQKILRSFIKDYDFLHTFMPPSTYALLAKRQQQRNPLISMAQALFIAHQLAIMDNTGRLTYRADKKHNHAKPEPYFYAQAAETWRHISSPTLLIHGDTVAHNYYLNNMIDNLSERLAAYPNAEVVKIPGSGHMLHWEAPEALALSVENFLSRH